VVGITVSTKILDRVGAKAVTAAAMTIAGIGMLRLGGVGVDGSYVADLLPTILLQSFGMGMAFPALQIAALHEVSAEDAGLGSGVQNTVVQIGGSLGLAVLVTMALRRTTSALVAGTAPALAAVQGYALAFRGAAFSMFAAALVALWLVPGRPRQPVLEVEGAKGAPLAAERVDGAVLAPERVKET
jgi:MFS family permease